LRTAILYGTETEETALDSRLSTRFDFDFYFGVVGNRFCAMALAGFPITIYGKGEQNKPQISLEDCVHSNVNAVRLEKNNKFNVYNQATAAVSIKELSVAIKNAAEDCGIKTEVRHIENPRVEKEEHKMTISNEKFMRLLGVQKFDIESGMGQVIKSLVPFKETIKAYKDSFIST
jgi:nucleoside-diphosphate-sugar epimerase